MGEDHQEGQEKDGGTVQGRTSTSGSYNERSGKLRKMEGDCCHSSKRIIEQFNFYYYGQLVGFGFHSNELYYDVT